MWYKLLVQFRDIFRIPIQESDKESFYQGINKTNLFRGKITSATFIFMELVMLVITIAVMKGDFLKKPYLYYGMMYLVMILGMLIFLFTFIVLGRNISVNRRKIEMTGILYVGFILVWCAGISLLDQITEGEIIVYVIAVIGVAVTPLYRPVTLFVTYIIIQTLFLILLPYFLADSSHLFGIVVNSSTIIIISWAISFMRFKSRAEDYINRKALKEKSKELIRVNGELESANRKLRILSQTDSLTGIYNRSVFDKMLKSSWNECEINKQSLSLIMADIDLFKAFNDNYGHQAGDDCLKKVAGVLSDCVHDTRGSVVRYGGEEFVVILPDMEKNRAMELAQKMRINVQNLRIQHEYSNVSDFVTISLGVYTVIPSPEDSINDFIKTADKALYKAKKEERNKAVMA